VRILCGFYVPNTSCQNPPTRKSLAQQLKRQVATTIKCDVKAFYLDEDFQVQWLMHEHMKHEAYLLVLWLVGIYNDKRPNEHATIVDAEGTEEKLEVCVMFFDKLYNCALVVKLPARVEHEELRPLPEPLSHQVCPHITPMPRLKVCLY
jgi:hypothetical protein